MKRALFITGERYPEGDAGSVRVHTLAKMFQLLGYEPTVVGMGKTTNFEFVEADGVKYTSLRYPGPDIVSRIRGRVCYEKHLKKMVFEAGNLWDVIVVSLVDSQCFNCIKKYASAHSSVLIYDVVEWYSPEQRKFGKLNLSYVLNNRLVNKCIDDTVKVISISSYLEEHFKNKNVITKRIPVVMDIENMKHNKSTVPEKTVFMYAGSPGKKDYLDVVIKGFSLLESGSFEFKVIGVTKEQLINNCGADPICVEKLGKKLCCMGRIPRQNVLEELEKADFTILMRSQTQRYAKAGFPTKFVESLASATPVIANYTSDLNLYLKNGENGYGVEDETAESLAKVLMNAVSLSYSERCRMQEEARKTAEKCFDFHLYSEDAKQLINA